MKKITSFDGIKIAYHRQRGHKDKPTILFLHGVGGNYTTWNNELSFFKKKGFPCIAVDLRGHGQSDAPDDFQKYSIESFAKDIEFVIEAEKVHSFILVGHSLGAGIASTFHMVTNRKADAVALIEPSIVYPFDHDHLLNHSLFATRFMRYIAYNTHLKNEYFPHFKDIDLSQKGISEQLHIIEHLLQITPIRSIVFTLDQSEKFFHAHFKDIRNFFKHFDHPLLVISSDEDDICPPKNAKKISSLNKEHAQFYLLHHAGHSATITNANEISKIVYDFLETSKTH